jgi:AraC-like DNA-binding protein
MLQQQAAPGPNLAHWIHSFRQYTFTPADDSHFMRLPGTGAELWLLNSGQLSHAGRPLSEALLCPRTRRFEFQQNALSMFAIRFRAGALPFFTQRPLAELVDQLTPPDAQWDANVVCQLRSVQRSPDFEERCWLAERILLSCLGSGRRLAHMHQLASIMFEQSADFVLSDYAGQVQRDRSVLSRQFHATQGSSAKYFHRLCRFERFLRDALFTSPPSLAGLALDHGYYDQAHMQHEVLQLSRQSPRRLLANKATHLFYSPRLTPAR